METKASYVLVGLFTVLAILLLIVVVLFSASGAGSKNAVRYGIEFPGAVYGLSAGSDVRFNGIKVGQVVHLNISARDPGIVFVEIEVSADTPVRKDSEATLEIQGITGMASVMISSGTKDSPLLPASHDDDALVMIHAGKSKLEHLMAEAPNILEAASRLMQRGSDVLSPENAQNLTRTLEALAKVSEALAVQSDALASTLGQMDEASKKLNVVLSDADRLINTTLTTAGASATRAFNSLNDLAATAKPAVQQFSENGVSDVYRILREISMLVRNLSSTVQRLNDNPSQFLFGNQTPEFNAPR